MSWALSVSVGPARAPCLLPLVQPCRGIPGGPGPTGARVQTGGTSRSCWPESPKRPIDFLRAISQTAATLTKAGFVGSAISGRAPSGSRPEPGSHQRTTWASKRQPLSRRPPETLAQPRAAAGRRSRRRYAQDPSTDRLCAVRRSGTGSGAQRACPLGTGRTALPVRPRQPAGQVRLGLVNVQAFHVRGLQLSLWD